MLYRTPHPMLRTLLLLSLAACDMAAVEPTDLPFEVVANGSYATAPEPTVVIARTPAEFGAVVGERLAGVEVARPDLGSSMAVFVFHSASPASATLVRVDGVTTHGSEIRVRATGVTPCITGPAVGSPWVLISVPVTEGNGVLETLAAETGGCE